MLDKEKRMLKKILLVMSFITIVPLALVAADHGFQAPSFRFAGTCSYLDSAILDSSVKNLDSTMREGKGLSISGRGEMLFTAAGFDLIGVGLAGYANLTDGYTAFMIGPRLDLSGIGSLTYGFAYAGDLGKGPFMQFEVNVLSFKADNMVFSLQAGYGKIAPSSTLSIANYFAGISVGFDSSIYGEPVGLLNTLINIF
jgi:hypothetical protein